MRVRPPTPSTSGEKPRPLRRGSTVLGALVLGFVLALTGGGRDARAQEQATFFSGLGFDACNAPALGSLQAWLASPYRALGVYIGGVNRACSNAQLSPTWITSAGAIGWALLPIYVGPQAPCDAQAGVSRISAANASAQGTTAALDAITQASRLGLPAGSPIYDDIEGYALNNPPCTQAVQTFVSAWVSALHGQGYLAGVYGSAASTMRDLQALSTTSGSPDDVWIADWNGAIGVFGDPYVSDGLWSNHQRIHQFSGGHDETYGGVTINIDGDAVDAAVVAGSAGSVIPTPPVVLPPPPADAALSAAGSLGSSDGVAGVSWPAGSFDGSVIVSLTPSLPSPPVAGFGAGGYGVRLAVEQTGTADQLTSFLEPLTITIGPQQGSLAPMYSTDGASWKPLPGLVGDLLPSGTEAAFAREPDGSVQIETRVAGMFALLPSTTPPPAPVQLSGHFSYGSLVLGWPASTDATGNAVSYRVSLGTQPLLTVGGETGAALRVFHPHAASVYRVQAIDAAGNISLPSPPLIVLPSHRPAGIPDELPAWAWRIFHWQQDGAVGPRPAAPKPLPGWYWLWRAWRVAPFHVER